MKSIKDILFTIIISVCLILFLKVFVLDFKIVASESMYPTLEKGDVIVVSKLAYNIFGIEYKDPIPDDIIVFNQNQELLIKRIDKIDDSEGIYVLGDNSLNSTDSRNFGFIKEDSIVGKAIIKFNLKKFTFTLLNE